MKYLIVVRHGDYDEGGEDGLNEDGWQQVRQLASLLARRLQDCSISMLISPATRTQETAEILMASLRVLDASIVDSLCSNGGHLDEDEAANVLKTVETKAARYDVVLLCTHWEFTREFPGIWARSTGFSIPQRLHAPCGTAFIINAEDGSYERTEQAPVCSDELDCL